MADQQPVIAALGLHHHRIQDRHRGQAESCDLPALEAAQKLQQAAPGQFGAARFQRDLKRIEHPPRGRSVAREHRLHVGSIEDRLVAHHPEKFVAVRMK
jgi:hypothetical protein